MFLLLKTALGPVPNYLMIESKRQIHLNSGRRLSRRLSYRDRHLSTDILGVHNTGVPSSMVDVWIVVSKGSVVVGMFDVEASTEMIQTMKDGFQRERQTICCGRF